MRFLNYIYLKLHLGLICAPSNTAMKNVMLCTTIGKTGLVERLLNLCKDMQLIYIRRIQFRGLKDKSRCAVQIPKELRAFIWC